MDNLPELKDIHLPEGGVSVFPPAAGWWLVLAAVLAAYIGWRIVLWLKQNSKKLYARYLLKKNAAENTPAAAVKMSELLRRICISRYPEAVSYSGEKWIAFVNEHSKVKLAPETARLLADAPYAPEDSILFSADNIAALRRFCQSWIGANL